MKNKILALVKKICTNNSDCRGLNNKEMARELMNIANIPGNAEIEEIPLNWNNQVVILFLIPGDKNYYSLFAGIGNDNEFHFELSITGILQKNGYFDFFAEEEMLPINYFDKEIKRMDNELDEIFQFHYEDEEPNGGTGYRIAEIPSNWDAEDNPIWYDTVIFGKKKEIAQIYRAIYKASKKGKIEFWQGSVFDFSCPKFNESREYYGIRLGCCPSSIWILNDEDLYRIKDDLLEGLIF